jgi:hypothetical protein
LVNVRRVNGQFAFHGTTKLEPWNFDLWLAARWPSRLIRAGTGK